MSIQSLTFADLLINTMYQVKFSMLQRLPEYIKLLTLDDVSASFTYCDVNGNILDNSVNIFVNSTDNVFIVN